MGRKNRMGFPNNSFRSYKGYLTPASWDEDENIGSLLLEADDDREYIIDYFGPEIDLSDWVDHRVEITGKTRKKRGKLYLSTSQIIDIDEDDEPIEGDVEYDRSEEYDDYGWYDKDDDEGYEIEGYR